MSMLILATGISYVLTANAMCCIVEILKLIKDSYLQVQHIADKGLA
jgi:hypothetical protein